MGVTAGVLFLALVVTVLAVTYLIDIVGDETDEVQNQPRRWWQKKLSRFHNLLVKSLPLSTIRIVVVVLQIVIQVRAIRDGHKPVWLLLIESTHRLPMSSAWGEHTLSHTIDCGVFISEHLKICREVPSTSPFQFAQSCKTFRRMHTQRIPPNETQTKTTRARSRRGHNPHEAQTYPHQIP